MSIKSILTRLFPSYRMGNVLRSENAAAQQQMKTRLDQLDYKMEYLFWLSQKQPDETLAEAKQRVFRSMPKAEGQTRLVQQMNHKLLIRLKQVCDANGLQFYLVFGTLMGAVRNQGFIPWDDDLDVAMMRADAERLIQILKDDPEITADHCYSIMYEKFIKVKFRDSDKFFVDVFFLDAFQADASNLEERYAAIMSAHREYVAEMKRYFAETGSRITDFRVPKPDAALDARMEAKYRQLAEALDFYGKGNYVCFAIDDSCLMTNTWYAYPKEIMLEPVSMEFEGEVYQTFANYDSFLRNTYGDYWQLPRNLMGGHSEFAELTAEDFGVMVAHGVFTKDEAERWAECSSRSNLELFQF